jgi:hypothetical protein
MELPDNPRPVFQPLSEGASSMLSIMSKSAKFAPLAVLALATPVHADVILYNTSFENPPFTTGPIAGQDGWNNGSGISTIENTFARTGSQAVFVDGSSATQSGPWHPDITAGPLIDLSADLAIFTSTNQSARQFAGLGPNLVPFIGGIDISSIGSNSSIFLITPGFPVVGTFPRATAFNSSAWHHVDFLFNLATQTYNFSFDGSLLASSVPFCGSNAGCSGAAVATYGSSLFDTFGGVTGGNDSGYMDNFRLALVTPEPSSIALMVTALGALCLKLRRRGAGR